MINQKMKVFGRPRMNHLFLRKTEIHRSVGYDDITLKEGGLNRLIILGNHSMLLQ